MVAAGDDATRITSAFSGRPARGLDNRYIRDMAGREDMFPDFPINNTLTGPLRKASAEAGKEDFMSLWSGQAAALCSTGEQKALLIALVLGSARMRAQEQGTAPMLLLDEIAAHLDSRRLGALFDEILCLGAQVWMTGTDSGLFEPLAGRAQFFSVAEATVTAVL
ncbi:MAG: hypothetical protein COC02_04670 [Rhodospirillaceae bacterium]|nr:MAG: hypothetical protein COC02_04670 [Rhodospirillaceae bacterium]